MALWDLIYVAEKFGLKQISIAGDSQMIIWWDKGETNFQALILEHCMENVRMLISSFTNMTFHHIYHKINTEVDSLSKTGIGVMDCCIHFEVWKESILFSRDSWPFG